MADIRSMTEYAAVLYRGGVKFPDAVNRTLDRYDIYDPFLRETLRSEICSRLGKRGAARKAVQRRTAVRSGMGQMSIRFTPPRKL